MKLARIAAASCLPLLFGVGARAAEPDPVLVRPGAETYHAYCAACHGATGVGDGPVAMELKHPPADLTRIAARRGGKFPDADLARFIDGRFDVPAHGTREMPIWGRIFQEKLAPGTEPDEVARGRVLALIEYLKTIQRP
jgi:mono/diheme cytochrome c family protein